MWHSIQSICFSMRQRGSTPTACLQTAVDSFIALKHSLSASFSLCRQQEILCFSLGWVSHPTGPFTMNRSSSSAYTMWRITASPRLVKKLFFGVWRRSFSLVGLWLWPCPKWQLLKPSEKSYCTYCSRGCQTFWGHGPLEGGTVF